MLPKKPDVHSSSDFKPVACLLTIYRLLPAIISEKVYAHCKLNNILKEEQNLDMAYIDYKQAFPLVPYDYLINILKAYRCT